MTRIFIFLHFPVVLGVQKQFEKKALIVKQKASVLTLGDQAYEPEDALISPNNSCYMLYKVYL